MDFGKVVAWGLMAVAALVILSIGGFLLQLGLDVIGLFIGLIASLAGLALSLVFSKVGLLLIIIALLIYAVGRHERDRRQAHWY